MKSEPDIIEFANVLAERDRLLAQLTETQNECTRLLLENRKLKASGLAPAVADVEAFILKFRQEINFTPKIPSARTCDLRRHLITEEISELITKGILKNDLVEIADGIADAIYVLIGAACAYGIPLSEVWAEVQKTNMAKENGGTDMKGKVLKPEGWTAPDIKAILAKAAQ